MPRKTFHEELKELQVQVLEMGQLVIDQIDLAAKAVIDCNIELAEKVIAGDDRVDAMNLSIEEQSLALIARQAPVAKDLRFCFSVVFIAVHLERMSDLCVNMARGAKRVCPVTGVAHLFNLISEMGDKTKELVATCLEAFEKRDLTLAERLGEMDEPIDKMFKNFLKELSRHSEEESMEWLSSITLTSRYLERIADHAVDIGERITYLITGHTKELD